MLGASWPASATACHGNCSSRLLLTGSLIHVTRLRRRIRFPHLLPHRIRAGSRLRSRFPHLLTLSRPAHSLTWLCPTRPQRCQVLKRDEEEGEGRDMTIRTKRGEEEMEEEEEVVEEEGHEMTIRKKGDERKWRKRDTRCR